VIPEGFFERFSSALQASEVPVKLSEVRVSAEPLNSTARGLSVACAPEQEQTTKNDRLSHRAAETQPNRRRQDRQRHKFGADCKKIQ
jgi:hypothetical protein